MRSLYKSKLVPVLVSFISSAPVFVTTSMGFRFLFIAMQVLSVWFIFGWVGGDVNEHVLSVVGLPAASYVYLCIGAAGFIVSTVSSFLSKICALKATLKFESFVVERSFFLEVPVTKGDLKSIVKLLISVLDVIVPLGVIFTVSVLWVLITPYALVLFVFVLLSGVWILKKSVGFSAKRYKCVVMRGKLDRYLGSEEHLGFYKILLLPNYITLVLMSVMAVSIVLSIIAAKVYSDLHGASVGHMAILTGVALLQIKSFNGIILRAGAYNKSIAVIYGVLTAKKGAA